MTPRRDLPRLLENEAGFTLIEMLTVLGILGIVLSALMAMFVSGIRAEADMNQRFQAQQEVRQAFSKLRREAHCASNATTTGSTVTFTLGAYCPTAGGASQATWCTVSLGPQRYGLFREPGPADGCGASSVKQADYLTSNSVFSSQIAALSRRRLHVALVADANPSSPGGAYALDDTITLRNSGWFGPKLTIAPSYEDGILVGTTHTLTVTLATDMGNGFQPAAGEHVDVVLTNAISAKYTNVTGTCTNAGPNTDANGQCTISFTSMYPGTVIAHATSTLSVGGTTTTVATNGTSPNSGDAITNFVTA